MPTILQALGRSVKRLQQRHHRLLDAALAEVGSTLAQWDALRAVSVNPNASSHLLAEFTFQTDQSFGSLAMRLVTKGLVSRAQGRGKIVTYSLTPGGEEVLKAGYLIAERELEQSFSILDKEDRIFLLKLLAKTLGDDV